jgi:hypothetical protein
MNAVPVQRAQDVLRETLAAMSDPQLARVSYSAQIPRSVLAGFIAGRQPQNLSAAAMHRLGEAVLVGRYFQKTRRMQSA